MFNWQNQMQGGMPQQQQGGQPQMPMGGQQGLPQPRPGPAQLGPGMGGGQPQAPTGGFFGAAMANQPGAGASGYQSQIDDLQQQLMMAQANGAPPQVIGNLQLQLQQAQRGMQQAGMQAMYQREVNAPQYLGSAGQNAPGGRASGAQQRGMQNYDAGTQLLMALYGMGGGRMGIGG